MASESKIPKKTQSLIEKLRSTESKIVVQTIRLLEAEGDEHILRPLLDTYKANTVEATRNAVVEFFNKLSDSRAINEMIQMIREEENADVRKMLIASCWQNKLDFT
ncbi:MAG: HEAT repeat domain-containing protein, partial [Bacteroidetes bacterium]|nr:HEAT repeat domain-containing protein [Bacteroidota bacterium]